MYSNEMSIKTNVKAIWMKEHNNITEINLK